MYQDDASVRRALIEGYNAVRPDWHPRPGETEAFLCTAALSNLSFQITIPQERASPVFARNVREFATIFCRRLIAGEPFVLS
jgi:hypothetical protein